MLYQLSYFRNFPFLRRASLPSFRERRRPGGPCGRRWIRTTEVERQQIYSLPHLATLVSARMLKNRSPPGETASGECRDVFLPSLFGDGECNALVGMPIPLGRHKSKDHFSILQKGAPFCLNFIYFCARKSGRRHSSAPEADFPATGSGCRAGKRDRKSTRLNSSHRCTSRMPSSA